MKIIYNFIKKSFEKEVDAIGLSVFRIAYFTVFLCEISQIFYYRHLIFDKIPYIEPSEINIAIPLILWIFVILNLIIGYRTRFYIIINYFFTIIFISLKSYNYYVFYVYTAINFLLMFIPINNRLSLDSSLSNFTEKEANPTKVKQFYYFIIPFITLGIVYLDSFFLKITATSWKQGLGLWKPASSPMFINYDLTFILNHEYLMYFIGYFVLLFEFIFIFLFFRKKWRFTLIFIGVLFHLGIIIAFPLPWFGLTYISIYILLFPIYLWERIYIFLNLKIFKNKIYYLLSRTHNFFDYKKFDFKDYNIYFWSKIIFLYTSFHILFLSCALIKINSKNNYIEDNILNKYSKTALNYIQPITGRFFGIFYAGIFIDQYHYDGYEHIVAITYWDKESQKEIWLPYVNKQGNCKLSGVYLSKYNFKMSSNKIKQEKLQKGIRDFTAFWAFKNGKDLKEAQFYIKVKKIVQPQKWEKDFLKKQMEKPWIDGGKVIWKEKKIEYYIKDIESL